MLFLLWLCLSLFAGVFGSCNVCAHRTICKGQSCKAISPLIWDAGPIYKQKSADLIFRQLHWMKLWPVTGTLWKAYVESEHSRLYEEHTFMWQPFIITKHKEEKIQKEPIDQTLITLMINSLEICRDKYTETKNNVMWQLSKGLCTHLTKEVAGGNKSDTVVLSDTASDANKSGASLCILGVW